ncbi:small, acid-soluble spore protein, alpha/beta type [Ureibacillus manganicus]|uniref:Protein sspF n=1 Tax=Ureibacillus manganicus DSM 26584 TaxID=1384049 RepID=A0A0A3HVT8_9BACL|nr:small, acid-soluble spore protein, alpha/beta type [Ureibacillus manganicus]KGR76564.1 protein sspF [Ureibacillus manganicus DSM 26584]
MSRRKGIMSSRLKEEIAKELGFYDVVEREGWGGIRARDAGNMVKRAIEMAEQGLAEQANQNNTNK